METVQQDTRLRLLLILLFTKDFRVINCIVIFLTNSDRDVWVGLFNLTKLE